MASSKEIKSQIRSVQNTQKITKAMEMVAASKMKKAQDRMFATRPYADHIRQVLGHVTQASLDYKHPYVLRRDKVKAIGIIIVSTDRGLCGGLNINLFKKAMNLITTWQEQDVQIKIGTIGKKASAFFKRLGSIESHADSLGDEPKLEQILGCVKSMLDAYEAESIDRLFVVKNNFVNTMTQQPFVQQLLPASLDDETSVATHSWDYLYEPTPEELLDGLLKRYVETQAYQAVVENVACEMSARMIAMKSATDNAGDLIKNLNLKYNKARQAAITQELSEIVGGAAAV